MGAMEALAELADQGDGEAVQALATRLGEDDADLRRLAIFVLPRIAAPGDVGATGLVVAALEDCSGRVRREAAVALGNMVGHGDRVAVESLHCSLRDRLMDVRTA